MAKIFRPSSGPKLKFGRQLYNSVVRATMAYRCSIWYRTTGRTALQGSLRNKLTKAQNRCLRVLAGAYRPTSIEELQKEVVTESALLYLERRATATKAKFVDTPNYHGLCRILNDICDRARVVCTVRIHSSERQRLQRVVDPSELLREDWGLIKAACDWWGLGEDRHDFRKRNVAIREYTRALATEASEDGWRAYAAEKLQQGKSRTSLYGDWGMHNLRTHDQLSRPQSIILIQMKTEQIALKDFMHRCKVSFTPRRAGLRLIDGQLAETPHCECGAPQQTVRHCLLECPRLELPRRDLLAKTGHSDMRLWLTRDGSSTQPLSEPHVPPC
ncbi:hypothetical protein BU26DRAFT_292091 [Trematosphaeria pertusa]|uniref:Reverse transcriptase n=1 Tax=Trematosphaeria pertusa TaxID=390896 RepID=A0A6A6II66_9PLEO|nr:uncharacterized protein BU26DRAFT_292091 [Trematosphaeria pertusa]KAF2249899.1 hypothetical protein BU26DRAFT_292091 [Trematosphaeria pertusa]